MRFSGFIKDPSHLKIPTATLPSPTLNLNLTLLAFRVHNCHTLRPAIMSESTPQQPGLAQGHVQYVKGVAEVRASQLSASESHPAYQWPLARYLLLTR